MRIVAEKPGRVDKLLADTLPQYSRSALAKLFDKGLVVLDGRIVPAGHKVREGAVIDADISPLEQEQQVVELPILYEDDDVMVIDKPTGIISHARGRYWYEPSVASFVRWKLTGGEKLKGTVIPNDIHIPDDLVTKSYPMPENITENSDRMGIVHRLDRATSGVMICAKNDNALTFLQKQFSNRTVIKKYSAVLDGIPKCDEAVIDAPIERNPKKPSTFRIGPNGKSSQTHYIVIRKGTNRALVEFTPKTGRTHQLRIHAAYIKCSIHGDDLYGKKDGRLLLHAHSLEITLPGGERRTFTSEIPQEFYNAL